MTSILTIFLSYLLLYRYSSLTLIIFLGSFLLPLPNNAVILAAGAFSSQGSFNFWISLAICLVTNVLADALGYYVTWQFGVKAVKRLRLKEHPNYNMIEKYFTNYFSITVFVTRIFGPFGPLVNFISGFYRVPFRKFIFFDILGNSIFVVGYLSLGYFLGNYWQNFTRLIGWVGWAILGLFIIVIIIISYIRRPRV
jgi:membrane protein DedA with SNARE-associated domain